MPTRTNPIADLVTAFVARLEAWAAETAHARLASAFASLEPRRGPGRPPGRKNSAAGAMATKPRKPVDAKTRRRRQLQGKYLGTLRGLSVADRTKVKAVAKADGVAAALTAARKLATG